MPAGRLFFCAFLVALLSLGAASLPARAAVTPFPYCVESSAAGDPIAHFGYYNDGSLASVPAGVSNLFSPAPAFRGQPTSFAAGLTADAFQASFPGSGLTWTLGAGSAVVATGVTLPCLTPPSAGATPAVSGVPVVGRALATDGGAFSANPQPGMSYQWQRSVAGAWADIPGATGFSYTPLPGDAGLALRVVTTATNSEGHVSSTSPATAPVAVLPQLVAQPTVAATAAVGATLSVNGASWFGAESRSLQWQRCGSVCSDVPGAVASMYTVGSPDRGSRLRVLVTASSPAGSVTAASAETREVIGDGGPPRGVTPPAIRGTARLGSTLVASAGTWANPGAPLGYEYQWQRCARACADIPGATGRSYNPGNGDVGRRVRVTVTASDQAGSAVAYAKRTAVVRRPRR